ncbi:MAG: hypothetical protein JJE55_12545 [Flavobacteriaceae bacterium]|nr:hypothetical protein [Flavobacteriaceae bacterium]
MVPIKEIEYNAQKYVSWNKAWLKHFFNEDSIGKEVILYADPDLISSIGNDNNLGNYKDFLKVIIVNYLYRLGIYDRITNKSYRYVETNRQIKKIITEFPNTLNNPNSKLDLAFFNYIVFYISIYVDNQKSSFYDELNETISKYLPTEKKTQSLSELDKLFDTIENWSLLKGLGLFRARRIGNLNYVGLLNYQVVLKPELNRLFEELLYKYNITIDDNAIYAELANKLLRYVDNPSLRNKLIEAIKSPVYSEWFLNRALSFNHLEYGKSKIGSNIVVTRRGIMSFKIRQEDKFLILVSDTLLRENEIPIGFSLSQSGIDSQGFYSKPINLLGEEKVHFKDYKLTTEDNTLTLETAKINDVNFFVKTANGYLLTLLPQPNYDLLVVVRKNPQTLKHWEMWSKNPNNIRESQIIESQDILLSLFGNNYVFYSAFNIQKPYYKNEEDIIYEINTQPDLNLSKLGGLKINKNTYLDIGLPYFRLDNLDILSEDITVKVYRNNAKDIDIEIDISENIIRLFINNEVVISEPSLVIVKFSYKNLEKSFDFIIVGSKLKPISQNNLFKYNTWGEKSSDSASKYLQGNNIINGTNILSNTSRHILAGLVEDTSYDDNYFIYLLAGLDSLIEDDYLRRKHINKAIDASLIYLESKGYQIADEKYSRTNLISNLCALGFLNKLTDENDGIKYQLLPPALIKIEKSFSVGSRQVYQLIGVRSKYLIQRLVEFCDLENIQIRYKRYNIQENNSLEKALLPEIIYLDVGGKLNRVKVFFDEQFTIDIHVENEIHLGDSLCNFITSTAEYESKYLVNRIPLGNQPFEDFVSLLFPRIVTSSELYQSKGQVFKKRFLEKNQNEYYEIKQLSWARLFVAKEKNLPVLLMKKQYEAGSYKLSPNTYIPSKYRLPEIVYRAFCSINHGIPKTIKIFIKNAKGLFNVEDQSFMHFDYYKFSDKINRRENIIRIITGIPDVNSSHVIYTKELNKSMKFVTCSLFSSIKSAVLIYDVKGNCTAIISNYKELFINTAKIDQRNLPTKKCQFGTIIFDILKIENNDLSLNQKISLLLDNNLMAFNYETPSRNIKFDIVKEEKILIKEIC